ncbi:hypothetical protein ASZ90_017962 [hydrocarbon metagenome]|uniref:Uncharacterized protein n=1 Tax=hydrocarbon metagenome TaxID=938273 RepID=A0A0W8E7V1_9ZZZZ
MLYILVIFLGLIIVFELPTLLKGRLYKDLLIVVALVALSAAYGIAYYVKSTILPNPNRIFYAAQPLAETFQSLLQIGDESKP